MVRYSVMAGSELRGRWHRSLCCAIGAANDLTWSARLHAYSEARRRLCRLAGNLSRGSDFQSLGRGGLDGLRCCGGWGAQESWLGSLEDLASGVDCHLA
eukprot:4140930-Pleurochrysis_carterae.AAC.1